jgi:hypothetical protein
MESTAAGIVMAGVGWAKALLRRAHRIPRAMLKGWAGGVLSSGAHSRDPLALPALRFQAEPDEDSGFLQLA